MRRHLLIMRWCLRIYHNPSSIYTACKQEDYFLRPPYVNNLNKFSNFRQLKTGFNPNILKESFLNASLERTPEYKNCCNLL